MTDWGANSTSVLTVWMPKCLMSWLPERAIIYVFSFMIIPGLYKLLWENCKQSVWFTRKSLIDHTISLSWLYCSLRNEKIHLILFIFHLLINMRVCFSNIINISFLLFQRYRHSTIARYTIVNLKTRYVLQVRLVEK